MSYQLVSVRVTLEAETVADIHTCISRPLTVRSLPNIGVDRFLTAEPQANPQFAAVFALSN